MALLQDLHALLSLQAIDTQTDRAKAILAGLDTGAKTAAAYQTAKAHADARQVLAHKAQTDQRDAEMRLTSIETKTVETNKSLYGGKVTATRELENLQKELDMLARQKAAGEDAVLEAMENAGTASTEAASAAQTADALASQYRILRATYKTRHGELSEEIAACEKARRAALAPLAANAALLSRYESLRKQRGGIGISPLQDDGTCGACHTKLSGNLVDDVRAMQTVHVCEHCGRILTTAPPS